MLFQLAHLHQPLRNRFDPPMHLGKFRIANGLAFDRYALIHAHQMRRGVESRAVSCLANNAGEHRRGRSFAVCSRDDNAGEPPLWMPKRFGKHSHVLQIELSPRLLVVLRPKLGSKREQTLDCRLVRGGQGYLSILEGTKDFHPQSKDRQPA